MPIPIGKLALYTAAAGSTRRGRCPCHSTWERSRRAARRSALLGYRAPGYRSRVRRGAGGVRTRRSRLCSIGAAPVGRFKQHNALRILDRYRHRLPCFNDDIQGTGASFWVACSPPGGRRAACAANGSCSYGAGAAGIGIARAITRQLLSEGEPPTRRARRWHVNSRAWFHTGRNDVADDSGRTHGPGRFLAPG